MGRMLPVTIQLEAARDKASTMPIDQVRYTALLLEKVCNDVCQKFQIENPLDARPESTRIPQLAEADLRYWLKGLADLLLAFVPEKTIDILLEEEEIQS